MSFAHAEAFCNARDTISVLRRGRIDGATIRVSLSNGRSDFQLLSVSSSCHTERKSPMEVNVVVKRMGTVVNGWIPRLSRYETMSSAWTELRFGGPRPMSGVEFPLGVTYRCPPTQQVTSVGMKRRASRLSSLSLFRSGIVCKDTAPIREITAATGRRIFKSCRLLLSFNQPKNLSYGDLRMENHVHIHKTAGGGGRRGRTDPANGSFLPHTLWNTP